MPKNVYKSPNFDKNLDSKLLKSNISKQMVKGEQILFQTSNNIAPFDPNRDARRSGQAPHLRQFTSLDIQDFRIKRSWDAPYAAIRYEKNNKNPQTTKWVEKGYAKKKSVLLKIQSEVLE